MLRRPDFGPISGVCARIDWLKGDLRAQEHVLDWWIVGFEGVRGAIPADPRTRWRAIGE
jgi:hypothetical protein